MKTDQGDIEYAVQAAATTRGCGSARWPLARGKFISVSRYGYLRTPIPQNAYIKTQAALYKDLLDHLNIQKVIVIGGSAGGPSATQFANDYPERTAAVILISCTITSAMVKRSGYIPEFVDFWSANPAVEKIWMSIFTPQRGGANVECLTADERRSVVETLMRVRQYQPKLDMPKGDDRGIPFTSGVPRPVHLRPDNAYAVGGFEDPRRTLPV